MKQTGSVREAGSMLKERLLDRRVDKLSRENDKLRDELDELKHELDTEQERTKDTLSALSKARRPGRMKWLVLAGGAYVLGAKAGRARYEQMMDWVRSMRRPDGNGSSMTDMSTGTTGTGSMTGVSTTSTGSTGTGSTGADPTTTGSTTTRSTTTGSKGSTTTGSTTTGSTRSGSTGSGGSRSSSGGSTSSTRS